MTGLPHLVLFTFFYAAVLSESVNSLEDAKDELAAYIENKKLEINSRYRLLYHVMPPVGWMNDPNGFSYYKGKFHLFYQYYPYDSVWGPMHWGHSASPDLVHWMDLPTALIPEEEQCFSGSAVADGDVMTLIYTAHMPTSADPFYNESQYLAFSDDGVDFHKYDGNPVLPAAPNGSPDFRDPKAWRYGDHWYAVVGSKTLDQKGRVLLYKSKDLLSWELLSVLGESKGDMGYMWECPDFFELGGKFVLLMSPQGMAPKGDRYKNTFQTGYIIGNFDYTTNEFTPETEFQEMDFGHDFYAAQTIEHNGIRYVVAWFSMWEVPHVEDADGWSGAMTIVRELHLADKRILMKPVAEMERLRQHVVLNEKLRRKQARLLPKASELIINGNLLLKFEMLLEGTNGGGKVWIRWDPRTRKISVDRGSGDVRQVEWSPIGARTLRLFLDTSSLELFCGEGEVVFSSRVYPLGGWRLTNLSWQSLNIRAYQLARSVPN
ncbi:sucrose-6-phosphate hydrolase-like [Leptidea sinapis]|uniref:sucrose-6-phosphate hydrolase-like n=1 Tax=Leptidea sinapis TaxID=189913 RepID=UPI0021248192|nr:sucrose-6-phosphate hydrolase-like [Leptidea sinapis]